MQDVGNGWSILLLFIFALPNVPVHGLIEEPTKLINWPATPMPPSTVTPETTTTINGTGPQTICADFENAVECNKYSKCSFDSCKSICVERSGQECSKDSYLTKCRRGNSWYAVCGMLCKSHNGQDKGKCKPKGIAIAVNLNGPALPGGDSKRVPHEADAVHLYNDSCPTTTRGEIDNVSAWCKKGITGINEKDRGLYNTLIYGRDDGRGSGNCISYKVNFTKDGRYEFNLRLVEPAYMCYGLKQQRHFNVRLNGQLVLPELEILLYASYCQGMDLFTEFDVKNGYLTPAGFDSKKISNDDVVLVEFCYGDGEPGQYYDPSYVVASFYIVELTSNDKPMPTLPTTATTKIASTTKVVESTTDMEPMTTSDRDMDTTTDPGTALTSITPDPSTIATDPSTTRRSTTEMTRRTTTKRKTTTPKSILSTTLKPVPPGPQPTIHAGKCSNRNENFSFCTCLDPHNRCDAVYVPDGAGGKFQCVKRHIFCDKLSSAYLKKMFPGDTCKRARGTYSYGGFICNNEKQGYNDVNYTMEDDGECDILKTVIAVRFNGNTTHKDVRGIEYQPFSKAQPDKYDYKIKPVRLRYREDGNTLCDERPIPKKIHLTAEADYELWEYYATGVNTSKGDCFSYLLKNLTEDGTYELMIKTTDYEYEEKDDRAFNIKLAGHYVFRELDPHKIWKAICVATELITIFDVTDNLKTITPRGFPSTPIPKEGIEVAFCRGECRNWAKKNFEFIGIAFSVHKIMSF